MTHMSERVSPTVKPQWQLVPREPTTEMEAAGEEMITAYGHWNAMIAIAPAPTEWLERAQQLIDDLEWQSGLLAKFPGGRVGRDSARAQLSAHLASVAPPEKP